MCSAERSTVPTGSEHVDTTLKEIVVLLHDQKEPQVALMDWNFVGCVQHEVTGSRLATITERAQAFRASRS